MNIMKQMHSNLLTRLSLLVLVVSMTLISGDGYSDNRVQFTAGFIAAVGIEVDEDGHPMLAEYDSDGFIVGDVGYLGLGDLEEVSLYPAASWRAFEQYHLNLIGSNPEATLGAKLISAEQYESRSFRTRTEPQQPIKKPKLRDNSKSVFVIAEDMMLSATPLKESFILAEYPIALHQNAAVAADTVTLIINTKGEIVRRSKFDISFKAAIYNEENRDSRDGFERLWQPIPNADVSAGDTDLNLFPGGRAISEADGRYSMTYSLPPCPGFSYDIDVPILATLDIQNFNPKATDLGFMTAYRNDNKVCVGYGDVFLGASLQALSAQLEAQAIVATLATPIYNVDIWFSTMQVNAIGTMPGIKLKAATRYVENSQVNRLGETEYRFDFNLDGELDTAVFNPENNDQIDVYYSPNKPTSETRERNPPDFTRLADYDLLNQLDHQGLLSEISREDLEDTDIHIFRRSTGQLL
ncbi:MAG: hypothetical protein GY887_10530, partial [Halieaceae bacterium]|nr:hypothetical protein [Halieaceae bacterium]